MNIEFDYLHPLELYNNSKTHLGVSYKDGLIRKKYFEALVPDNSEVYLKVYRFKSLPNLFNAPKFKHDSYDDKFREFISEYKNAFFLGYKTVNYKSLLSFWTSADKTFTAKTKKLSKENRTYLENIYSKIKEHAKEHFFNEEYLLNEGIKREFYLVIPYYHFKDFKGKKVSEEKLTQIQKKVVDFCDKTGLKPAFEDYLQKSQSEIFKYKQKSNSDIFMSEMEKHAKEYFDIEELKDEEVATFYNENFMETIYINLNGKWVYLSIIDIIRILAEKLPELDKELKTFERIFVPEISSHGNLLKTSNRFEAYLSLFRIEDKVSFNAIRTTIEDLEGDVSVTYSFVPIEPDRIYKEQEQIATHYSQLYGYQIDNEIDNEDIENKSIAETYYETKLKENNLFEFNVNISVRVKNETQLNIEVQNILTLLKSKGFQFKRISSKNFEKDINATNFLGVLTGIGGRVITQESIGCFNPLKYDFSLTYIKTFICNLGDYAKLVENKKDIEGREK